MLGMSAWAWSTDMEPRGDSAKDIDCGKFMRDLAAMALIATVFEAMANGDEGGGGDK